MTVRESLMFAANLKLPPTENYAEVVIGILEDLELTKAADTKVGGPMVKGISGGERKRTSIGVELITNPNLIFLDEPTTGLDSYTAETVVSLLKNLAKSGRTVIATIHQPNSATFALFDKLMLLANGKIIYFSSAQISQDYFNSIGQTVPVQSNPAEYYLQMMSIENYEEADTADLAEMERAHLKNVEKHEEKINQLHGEYKESIEYNDPDENDAEVRAITRADEVKYTANFFK